MSPAELRRLAGSKLVAASELEHDADRLRTQSDAMTGLLEPLAAMSSRVWAGPAAEDFEEKARRNSQELDRQGARLTAIAAEFREEAVGLRREATELQRAATLAELAVAAGSVH